MKPAPTHTATGAQGLSGFTGLALTPMQTAAALLILVLTLWVAYRIGRTVLRIAVGLLFLGAVAYGLWYLLNR